MLILDHRSFDASATLSNRNDPWGINPECFTRIIAEHKHASKQAATKSMGLDACPVGSPPGKRKMFSANQLTYVAVD